MIFTWNRGMKIPVYSLTWNIVNLRLSVQKYLKISDVEEWSKSNARDPALPSGASLLGNYCTEKERHKELI
jgi:hypothetical protein